jgi:hypothetical protein
MLEKKSFEQNLQSVKVLKRSLERQNKNIFHTDNVCTLLKHTHTHTHTHTTHTQTSKQMYSTLISCFIYTACGQCYKTFFDVITSLSVKPQSKIKIIGNYDAGGINYA